MLEYLLVRTEDRPIIEQSSGKLRWIVLDEAHTYVGSQAAEMALLLRRVTHRFGVDPSDVRYVATSATIGDANTSDDLQRFLADLSGAPLDRVHVVTGERLVPTLPQRDPSRAVRNLNDPPDEALYGALCHDPAAREVRACLAREPTTLKALQQRTGLDIRTLTALLEKASTARRNDTAFLPLRVHLLHRAQSGLWACVNSSCGGRDASLDESWDFGALFPERRTCCEHCDYPVFELVVCGECGQDHLSAEEEFSGETGKQELKPFVEEADIDEFQLEIDLDDDSEEVEPLASSVNRRLVCGRGFDAELIEEWRLKRDRTLSRDGDGIPICLSRLDTGPIACPRCGIRDNQRRRFRELRIGAPFTLSTIVPTALEHTPPMRSGAGLPSQGKRLLGFSDSRQGSARLVVRLQQEAERNRIRSILYHALAAERHQPDTQELESQIAALQQADNPALRQILEQKTIELAQARAESGLGTLTWKASAEHLKGDSSLRRMRKYFRDTSYISSTLEEFADFCLYREFFRRPKRMNSAETMGLISLGYPVLKSTAIPPGWPLQSEDWPVFLKLVVDFFARDASADALDRAMDDWRREVDALRKDAAQFEDGSGQSRAPAVLAIKRQLSRLEGEYLLGELANRLFLPGYGFPNGIVSFIPLTIDELKRRHSNGEDRDERLGKRLGYPSRQIETAIREYAPGAEVVMDGRVYESGGVTLNWHLPPGVESAREIQALRHVWRCRECGATGDAPSPPAQCPQCDGSLGSQKYLEPAGFAVDIRHSPHNNVVAPTYIPVEPPWISCPSPEWSPLADPSVGRFRYTDTGHLFHGNRGRSRHGYTVCLRCGRAASEVGPVSETGLPKMFRDGHLRLCGGKDPHGGSLCDGAGFALQRGLSLGGSRVTDVFELQLRELNDDGTALSLGIALRHAFCRHVGIEDEEVGVTVRPARAADGTIQQSIFLYDAAVGGNGYVAALREHIAAALKAAVHVLNCVKQCDAACHGCLLTHGTQHDWTKLNRLKALAFLTSERLAGLDLRQSDRLLGPESRMLTRTLCRHLAEVAGKPDTEEIQLWMGGDAESWEVEEFPLYSAMLRWADDERFVRLFIEPVALARLNEGSRHALASLVAAGRGRIIVYRAPAMDAADGVVIAAAEGVDASVVWAMRGDIAPMNDMWGRHPKVGPVVYARIEGALPPPTAEPVPVDELRPQHDGTTVLPVWRELNGRIEGFGSRFWNYVFEHCHPLKDQFLQGGPLTRVKYSDRYLATPWALLLLREVLLNLVREGQANSRTSLHLLTREIRPHHHPNRTSQSINDQWQDDTRRRSFFEQGIDKGRGHLRWKGPFRFETGNVPHFRELRLEWGCGREWTLKLDQGFGYWKHRPFANFPFDKSPREQVRSINATIKNGKVVAFGSHPTFVYVAHELDCEEKS